MLLTTDEYSKASVREDLASYGIIEHPFQQLFSCYDEGSELSGLRKNTLTALEATRSSVYTQVLYYVRMGLLLSTILSRILIVSASSRVS